MESISSECTPLKRTYEQCFHKWFNEKFLKGIEKEECQELLIPYQECVKVSYSFCLILDIFLLYKLYNQVLILINLILNKLLLIFCLCRRQWLCTNYQLLNLSLPTHLQSQCKIVEHNLILFLLKLYAMSAFTIYFSVNLNWLFSNFILKFQNCII